MRNVVGIPDNMSASTRLANLTLAGGTAQTMPEREGTKKNAIVRQPVEMRAKLDAKGVLESLIEEEKAELIEKLEQAADKARIEEELAACDQLLKRLREMRQPEAVE